MTRGQGGQEPGQVGDGSSEIELGGGLVTPEVPGLAQTQLHQPVQAMLHGLAEVEIGCESNTVLERAGGLRQGFLRVQIDLPPALRWPWHRSRGGAQCASPGPQDGCRHPPPGRSGNPPWGSGSGPVVYALW